MKQKSDEFATKKDLQLLREDLTSDLSKKIKEEIENAVVQISSAIIKSLDETNKKIDDTKTELKEEIREVKMEVIDGKRRLTDLESDMPSEKTCKKHDLRLTKIEKSVFA